MKKILINKSCYASTKLRDMIIDIFKANSAEIINIIIVPSSLYKETDSEDYIDAIRAAMSKERDDIIIVDGIDENDITTSFPDFSRNNIMKFENNELLIQFKVSNSEFINDPKINELAENLKSQMHFSL